MTTKGLVSVIAAIPVVLIGAFLLASVLSYAGGGTVESSPVPTTVTGTLTISTVGQCVLLIGPAGSKLSLLLPPALTMGSGEIKDQSGTVIASNGDRLNVSGPAGGIGDDACTPGTAPFLVQGIDRVP